MEYGLTWTGLSEMLAAGRGRAGSPPSRKGLLRPTDKTHNPRGDSTDLLPIVATRCVNAGRQSVERRSPAHNGSSVGY